MPVYDVELEIRDLQGLSSADAVVGLFTKLGYDTSVRTIQTASNLGIPEAAARPIKRIELVADHQKLLQVYLFELKSVTVAEIRALARVFRNFAGQFLLVLTSDKLRTTNRAIGSSQVRTRRDCNPIGLVRFSERT
jgi:hypothetical protein